MLYPALDIAGDKTDGGESFRNKRGVMAAGIGIGHRENKWGRWL